MHWCQDETLAAMSAVPVVGVFFRKIHKWYHKGTHHKCHKEGCEHNHLDHIEEEALLPNPPGRDVLAMEDVDFRYGSLATIFLMFDRKLLGTNEFPPANEFAWMESGVSDLSARWKNKFFIYDGQGGWELDPKFLPKPIPKVDSESKLIYNVENIVEVMQSIKRLSVEGGYLEAWFDEEEYGSSITSFIPDSFTRELLELIEYHILGSHEQDTGNSNQGLGQESQADSGPTQSNQEAT